MTTMRPVHRLEQAAYDAVRSTLPASQLRHVLTAYLAYWGLRHGNSWPHLRRRGLFEVISPIEKIVADRAAGAAVIILARAGDSDDLITHRCNRMREERAAYTFVILDHLVRMDVLPAYLDRCDALFFTPAWVGDGDDRLPGGCYTIRSRRLNPARVY